MILNAASFFCRVKRAECTAFKASLYDTYKAIGAKDLKECPLEEIVPEQYHEFRSLFSKVCADHLSPHRPDIDHMVRLDQGATPTWGPLYSMSRADLVVPKEWLEGNMSKEFISQSSSAFAAPVLFAKKPDGELQLCIDYRDINCKTMKHWYQLLLIKETLNLLGKAWTYTKVDVRGDYNLLQVEEGDEHSLAFRTGYGLFEPTVMQFGTSNAPADFQGYINNATRKAFENCASAYLDGVLIYSDPEDEHICHVKWIMERLFEAGLYLKPEKCKFDKQTVWYLGLIKSRQWISMHEDKVETVRKRSQQNKMKNGRLNHSFEIQQFLGCCNYCQRFIPKYSEKAEPFTWLTKKDEPFGWQSEQQLAFETMTAVFTTAPSFHHFDHEREVIVEKDASDYVSAGVLSQRDNEGI